MKKSKEDFLEKWDIRIMLVGFILMVVGMTHQAFKPEPMAVQAETSEQQTTTEPKMFNRDVTMQDTALIASLVLAEADGESEYGKRLVIDTVLNRVESDDFPNTIREVVYQPYHYSSVWDGRIGDFSDIDDAFDLVVEELINRTNSDVIFFRTERFHEYGTPWQKVGNHYFSTK